MGDTKFSICRCCLVEDIKPNDGALLDEEIYSAFIDNLNLSLSKNVNISQIICPSCISVLNEVTAFRKMVLDSEKYLIQVANFVPLGTIEWPQSNGQQMKTEDLKVEVEVVSVTIEDDSDLEMKQEVEDTEYNADDTTAIEQAENERIDSGPLEKKRRQTKEAKPPKKKATVKKQVRRTKTARPKSAKPKSARTKTARPKSAKPNSADEDDKTCEKENSDSECAESADADDDTYLDNEDFRWNDKEKKKTDKSVMKKRRKPKSNLKPEIKDGSDANLPYTMLPQQKLKPDVDFKLINGEYHCCYCKHTSDYPANMSTHINNVHLKTPRFGCTKCPEKFVYKSGLSIHALQVHNIGHKFNCNLCTAAYTLRSKLYEHIRDRHLLNERFECQICHYKTYVRRQFKKHQINHSNERNYHCSFCGKSFKRLGTLQFHEKIHIGDKRKVCSECGQAFVQKASLNYHMKKYHPDVPF